MGTRLAPDRDVSKGRANGQPKLKIHTPQAGSVVGGNDERKAVGTSVNDDEFVEAEAVRPAPARLALVRGTGPPITCIPNCYTGSDRPDEVFGRCNVARCLAEKPDLGRHLVVKINPALGLTLQYVATARSWLDDLNQ